MNMRDKDNSQINDNRGILFIAVVVDKLNMGSLSTIEHHIEMRQPLNHDTGHISVLGRFHGTGS